MCTKTELRIEDRGSRIEERAGVFSIPTPKSLLLFFQSGASLIELIMFIVIVSVALAGILLVMNITSKNSADPLIRKQALAVAYSLLEEVELQDFSSASAVIAPVTLSNRNSASHIVSDYNNFVMPSGIIAVNGDSVTGLEKYSASVAVVPEASAWNGIAAGSAVQITVTVTAPSVGAVTATGYRTAY